MIINNILSTTIWTVLCVLVLSLIIWFLVYHKSGKEAKPLGCLFGMLMLGAFLFPIIQGITTKNTVRVLIVDEDKTHREVMIKGVFHPRNGEDIYPNSEIVKSRTVLYNQSEKDMILYSVRYTEKTSQESNDGFLRTGHIIKAGEYIIIYPIEEPDYWFEVPSSIWVRTNNRQSSSATRSVLDFVSSLESQGFIVENNGIIRIAH